MIYISGIWINAHRKNGLTTDHRLKVLANYIYFDEKILIWSVLSTTICWREGLRFFYLSCNFVLKDVSKWASKAINSYDIYFFGIFGGTLKIYFHWNIMYTFFNWRYSLFRNPTTLLKRIKNMLIKQTIHNENKHIPGIDIFSMKL